MFESNVLDCYARWLHCRYLLNVKPNSAAYLRYKISLKIKCGITLGNRCYSWQLSCRDHSCSKKSLLYNWSRGRDAVKIVCSALGSIQEKKFFHSARVSDDFRFQMNKEVCNLLNDIENVQNIDIQQLGWFGNVVRIKGDVSKFWWRN